jgi:hypothetical protein
MSQQVSGPGVSQGPLIAGDSSLGYQHVRGTALQKETGPCTDLLWLATNMSAGLAVILMQCRLHAVDEER